MSELNEEEAVKKIFEYAVALKQSGKSDSEVEQTLVEKGIDKEGASVIVKAASKSGYQYREQDNDSGGMGWLIWIVILIVVNICSAIFDWPFWIY